MQRMLRVLGLAAVIVAATGVAAQAVINRVDYYPFYEPTLVQYVASKGAFQAVVIGTPFGARGNAALLSGLRLPGYYPQAPFVDTAVADRSGGHIVLLFDPAKTVPGGRAACATPDRFAAPAASGPLRLQAAFCFNDEVVSEAYMVVDRPAGPADPSFRQSMAQLLHELLPSRSPNRGDCGDSRRC